MLSWYLSSDKTFIFHLEDFKGNCIRCCGGIINDGSLTMGSGMAQYSFNSAIWAFVTHPWVIFHPQVRAKYKLILKNIGMKVGLISKDHSSANDRKNKKDPRAGLVVIGVNPKYHDNVYESILLREFERKSSEEFGMNKFELSVIDSNEQAIRVYLRNG